MEGGVCVSEARSLGEWVCFAGARTPPPGSPTPSPWEGGEGDLGRGAGATRLTCHPILLIG